MSEDFSNLTLLRYQFTTIALYRKTFFIASIFYNFFKLFLYLFQYNPATCFYVFCMIKISIPTVSAHSTTARTLNTILSIFCLLYSHITLFSSLPDIHTHVTLLHAVRCLSSYYNRYVLYVNLFSFFLLASAL